MVWLLLFIMTVPVVAVAADSFQRANTGRAIFTAGPFHEGEEAVYDLTYRSLFHDVNVTVEGQFRIEVGEVTPMRLGTTEPVDILPIHYASTTPPWIAARGDVDETEGTLLVRVPDGRVLEHTVHTHTVTHEVEDDGTVDRMEEHHTSTQRLRHGQDWLPDEILRQTVMPGETFIHGNAVVREIYSIVGHGAAYERGVLDGHEVYRVVKDDWHSDSKGAFTCFVDQPHLIYWDKAGRTAAGVENLTNEQSSSLWLRPGVAFPAYSSCRSVYASGDEVIEDLSLTYVLATHKEGGAAVPLEFTYEDVAFPTKTAASPALIPGLPAQGGADLLFPVEDLVGVLGEATELDDFRNERSVPFAVDRFGYSEQTLPRRGPTVGPIPTLPDPTGLFGQAPVPGERASEATWDLDLVNDDRQAVSVEIVRVLDPLGEIVEESLRVTNSVRHRGSMDPDDAPQNLLTLGEMLETWSRLDPEAGPWQDATHRTISLAPSAKTADGPVHSYFVRQGSHVEHPQYSWLETRATFDATDGRVLSEEVVSHDRTSERDPVPALMTAAVAVTIHPMPDAPTWAASSSLLVALVFLVVYFWEGIMRFGAVPLYAKLRKEQVLDHATRDSIVTYVSENPGATLGAVRQEIGVGHGTAIHHVNTLVRNGLLVSRKIGRQRCLFRAGTVSGPAMERQAVAASGSANRLLEAIRSEPGLSQEELAERLGVTSPAVRYQARRLHDHAVLRVERTGRRVRYYPAP